MLARVCAERSVFGFEASFISSRKNSFLSGGVVAGKEHRVKVPYAYRFFFLAANVKLPPDCPYRVRGKKEENYERKTRDCLRHLRHR